MKTTLGATLLAICLGGLPEEPAPTFTTTKAREALKTYQKTMERLQAEHDAKVKKARVEYLKSLESALKDAKKAAKGDDAALISKTIEELRRQTGSPGESRKKPGRVEKGPDGVTFLGGTGESIEEAVVIKGAIDSPGAVAAEGHWLRVHYPKHKKTGQALLAPDGKKLDVIEITGPDGAVKKVYFDITECFGFPKDP